MAKGGDSITLLAPPQAIWDRLVDFDRWTKWFHVPFPNNGWGVDFQAVDKPGPAARVALRKKGKPLQVFQVVEWTPPQRFKLQLTQWVLNKYIHGGAGSMGASILLVLTPNDKGETVVTMELEAEYTHPFFGPIYNLLIPLGGTLDRIAFEFFRRFPASLAEAESSPQ